MCIATRWLKRSGICARIRRPSTPPQSCPTDVVFRRPEQQRGHLYEFWQAALDGLHIGPAAVALTERDGAWPGQHDMVGIWLVKHVMIGPRLLCTQATTAGNRRPMLHQHLVPFHKELADERRMPGGPRAG